MSLTDLPLSFWGYALEREAFTLNRVPSKCIKRMPCEIRYGNKTKLSILQILECESYARLMPDKLKQKAENASL
jgi:hypothetical protein